jgi:hypothetical protein
VSAQFTIRELLLWTWCCAITLCLAVCFDQVQREQRRSKEKFELFSEGYRASRISTALRLSDLEKFSETADRRIRTLSHDLYAEAKP